MFRATKLSKKENKLSGTIFTMLIEEESRIDGKSRELLTKVVSD